VEAAAPGIADRNFSVKLLVKIQFPAMLKELLDSLKPDKLLLKAF
jgi:hypothetical protein